MTDLTADDLTARSLSPVLAYLKSWGQFDAYDRVLEARNRIEALEAERDEMENRWSCGVTAAKADVARFKRERDAALAEVAKLREAQPHKLFVYEKAGWVHVEMVHDDAADPLRWTLPLLADEAEGIARALSDSAASILARGDER